MKKYLLSILCGILLLPGCNYLDMVPEKDIETIESLFEQRTKVELWWKGLYAELNNIFADFRVNTAYLGADEFVTCQALHNSTMYNLDGLKVCRWPSDVSESLRVNLVQDVCCYPKL